LANLVKAYTNVGNDLDIQGDAWGAISHYREALRIRTDVADVHYNLGNALANLGHSLASNGDAPAAGAYIDEAIVSYRKALAISPEFLEARFNLAVLLAERKEFAEAIVHYEKALDLAVKGNDNAMADTVRSQIKKLQQLVSEKK
jgi:protein O-GlcNAc transferase